MAEKFPCNGCKRYYTWRTLRKYHGFCERCRDKYAYRQPGGYTADLTKRPIYEDVLVPEEEAQEDAEYDIPSAVPEQTAVPSEEKKTTAPAPVLSPEKKEAAAPVPVTVEMPTQSPVVVVQPVRPICDSAKQDRLVRELLVKTKWNHWSSVKYFERIPASEASRIVLDARRPRAT